MEYDVKQLKHFDKIKNAKSFFYRFRLTIEGDSSNIVFWKAENGNCYHFESFVNNSNPGKEIINTIVNKKIESNTFDKLIQDLLSHGIMKLKTDTTHKVMNNYHDYYYILLEDGKINSFQAICGHHSDMCFNKILDIVSDVEF